MSDERLLIEGLTEAAAGLVTTALGSVKGACLGTSAVLARTLADAGVTVEAVCGTYAGQPHWWLQTETLLIDATVEQFEAVPTVIERDADSAHETHEVWPAAWTHAQAVAEFARMFEWGSVGAAQGQALLDELAELIPYAQQAAA